MKNKVTAGLPAVDAIKRHLRDRHEFQRMKADQAVADAQHGKESLFAKDGDRDPQNEAQQKGRSIHWTRLAEKLKKLNYKLMLEPSKNYPDLVGIYFSRPDLKGSETPLYKGHYLHLMGFKTFDGGMLPQFSIKKKDETGKMLMIENRGWMKLLVDLAKIGCFTIHAAEKEFMVGSSDNDISHNYAHLTGRR